MAAFGEVLAPFGRLLLGGARAFWALAWREGLAAFGRLVRAKHGEMPSVPRDQGVTTLPGHARSGRQLAELAIEREPGNLLDLCNPAVPVGVEPQQLRKYQKVEIDPRDSQMERRFHNASFGTD